MQQITRIITEKDEQGSEITYVEIDPQALPYSLRRYTNELKEDLSWEFDSCSVTRQLRRQIERKVTRWVEANRDPGYIIWEENELSLMPSRFPKEVRGDLKSLAALLNTIFADYPDTEDTRQYMIDLIRDWIDIRLHSNSSDILKEMYTEIFATLKDCFGDELIGPGMKSEAAKMIQDYIRKKREDIINERKRIKATKAAAPRGTNEGGTADGTHGEPEAATEGISDQVPGEKL